MLDLRRLFILFLICLYVTPLSSSAEDFDGSKQLLGSVEKVLEINQFKISSDVDPDTVGLPKNICHRF